MTKVVQIATWAKIQLDPPVKIRAIRKMTMNAVKIRCTARFLQNASIEALVS